MRPFYRASDYNMKNSVGYLIRRTSNLMLPQLEALFADASLTFSQWTVLMALREWGNSTAGAAWPAISVTMPVRSPASWTSWKNAV